MSTGMGSRRLTELLWMRDRLMKRMRNSTDLNEVWRAYQDMKALDQYIAFVGDNEPLMRD